MRSHRWQDLEVVYLVGDEPFGNLGVVFCVAFPSADDQDV